MRRVELCTPTARRHAFPRYHHPPQHHHPCSSRHHHHSSTMPPHRSTPAYPSPSDRHVACGLSPPAPRWRLSCFPGFHALSAMGNIGVRQRPYRVECTGSLPNSEVKRRRARLVLGWGTAREDLRVLLAFCLRLPAAACCVEAGNGVVKAESPWGCDSTAWPVAGVPRLLDSTATGGSVQAAVWNAVCKHDWKVGIVECAE